MARAYVVGDLRENGVTFRGTSVRATVARSHLTGRFGQGLTRRGADAAPDLEAALNGSSAGEWIRAPSLELRGSKKNMVCNDNPKCALGRSGCRRADPVLPVGDAE